MQRREVKEDRLLAAAQGLCFGVAVGMAIWAAGIYLAFF